MNHALDILGDVLDEWVNNSHVSDDSKYEVTTSSWWTEHEGWKGWKNIV